MRNFKSCRKIRGLKSARPLSEPPSRFKTSPKLKGSRAKGKTYERLVGRKLKRRIENGELNADLVSERWFAFEDDNGFGYCQIDHYLVCPGFIVLIECKLTQTDSAEDQLKKLYEPILRQVYQCPVITVQVCKNLRRHPANALGDIRDIIEYPRAGLWTWHFIG